MLKKYGAYKKIVRYIVISMSVVLLVLLGVQYAKQYQMQQAIAQKVLRFHVLANSDSEDDQKLKLKVRDAVGAQMSQILSAAENLAECRQLVQEYRREIERTAECVIAEEGYSYTVHVFLQEAEFPVKTYGAYTFPAGTYEALRVVIGAGEGKNWWCVMYPNMCFSGSVYEIVDAGAEKELKQVLSEEEYQAVFASGNYRAEFKYLTFLNGLLE